MRRSMRPERLQSLKSIERAHQLGRSGVGSPKVARASDGRTISLSKHRWCGSLLAGSVYLPKASVGRPADPSHIALKEVVIDEPPSNPQRSFARDRKSTRL